MSSRMPANAGMPSAANAASRTVRANRADEPNRSCSTVATRAASSAMLPSIKLIGYTARRRNRGLVDVHVPLDDLTVLLGANDAGKSTLLRAPYEDLRGGPATEDRTDRNARAFFVEVTDDELKLLLPRPHPTGRTSPQVPRWDFGDYRHWLGDIVTEPSPEAYVAALGAAASGAHESFAIVLDALQTSRIVCLEPSGPPIRRSRGFEATWSTPSPKVCPRWSRRRGSAGGTSFATSRWIRMRRQNVVRRGSGLLGPAQNNTGRSIRRHPVRYA